MAVKDVLSGKPHSILGRRGGGAADLDSDAGDRREDRGRLPGGRLRTRRHAVGGVRELPPQGGVRRHRPDAAARSSPRTSRHLHAGVRRPAVREILQEGKWGEPVAVTEAKEDLVRCAIAVEGDGRSSSRYPANRQGRHDVYARAVHPKLGNEQNLRAGGGCDDAAGHLAPAMCTGQTGDVLVASQSWDKEGSGRVALHLPPGVAGEGGSAHVLGLFRGAGQAGVERGRFRWGRPTRASRLRRVSRSGDYDVFLPYQRHADQLRAGGDEHPVA